MAFGVECESAFIPEPAAVRSRGKRDVVGGRRRQTCQRVGCWLVGWQVWSAGLADISCSRLPRGTLSFNYQPIGPSVLSVLQRDFWEDCNVWASEDISTCFTRRCKVYNNYCHTVQMWRSKVCDVTMGGRLDGRVIRRRRCETEAFWDETLKRSDVWWPIKHFSTFTFCSMCSVLPVAGRQPAAQPRCLQPCWPQRGHLHWLRSWEGNFLLQSCEKTGSTQQHPQPPPAHVFQNFLHGFVLIEF